MEDTYDVASLATQHHSTVYYLGYLGLVVSAVSVVGAISHLGSSLNDQIGQSVSSVVL